ncbi:DUF4163 domain-containing protein [Viridibacillus sp. FSL R5-0477]|uniref:Uncharacterized protein n=1 Tax=Viridibacillus arenosi FSL R5-213 TaxID=1227360 RepID=W4EJV8_9BACL|nr:MULTISPECIES: DUF4163 domain-containing protein [Viridibacillus]ETT80850.1 hypothetical protein C176_19084 [Viridibacillus arenosi FSL R5-213]OMC81908.1 hypothetical protein BK128_21325 [Viridibacillus sp. FSL H7-0596]OMC92977.1 hypothetical protein BK137_00130 [Viridibacillus arenosi]
MKRSLTMVCSLLIAMVLIFTLSPLTMHAETKKAVTVKTHKFMFNNNIKYPQISGMKNKKRQKQINLNFKKLAKQDYKERKKILKRYDKDRKELGLSKKEYAPYEYKTFFTVKYNQNNKVSIVKTKYYYTGGAHGEYYSESYNYNTNSGKEVTLKQNFKTTAAYKKAATCTVKKILTDKEKYPLADKNLNLTLTPYYWTNSKSGINLIFQIYEIAPYSSGQIELPMETTCE